MAKKARAKKEEEQIIKLLSEILSELHRLNENLGKRQTVSGAANEIENALDAEDEGQDDSEELEYFE